jgi:hypothetical protein
MARHTDSCLHPLLEEIARWRKVLSTEYEQYVYSGLAISHQ